MNSRKVYLLDRTICAELSFYISSEYTVDGKVLLLRERRAISFFVSPSKTGNQQSKTISRSNNSVYSERGRKNDRRCRGRPREILSVQQVRLKLGLSKGR